MDMVKPPKNGHKIEEDINIPKLQPKRENVKTIQIEKS